MPATPYFVQGQLPGILVQWSQVTPVAPDVFQQYNVKRRVHGAGGTWTRIAVITSLGQTSYNDYTVASGIQYDYTVTWTSNRSGQLYESLQPAPTVGSVTFAGTYLHDATPGGLNAAANWVELWHNAYTNQPQPSVVLNPVWGRAQPTAVTTTNRPHHLTLQHVSLDPVDMTVWKMLEQLLGQQEQGSPLCFREGSTGDRFFVVVTKIQRDTPPYEYLPRYELDEIYLDEST